MLAVGPVLEIHRNHWLIGFNWVDYTSVKLLLKKDSERSSNCLCVIWCLLNLQIAPRHGEIEMNPLWNKPGKNNRPGCVPSRQIMEPTWTFALEEPAVRSLLQSKDISTGSKRTRENVQTTAWLNLTVACWGLRKWNILSWGVGKLKQTPCRYIRWLSRSFSIMFFFT